jgi:light-regulated signal transduction histidine kinase (bacteriophytochrome)
MLVPLQNSLQLALTNLQNEIEESGAQVDWGSLPSLLADRSLITLVFQNLLSNALKYRAEAVPHIRVEGKRENEEWIVSIADNGPGFNPAYAETIFEPFKRLQNTNVPGRGIGLATCKRIIERLGGRIWAESVPGRGATFYFTLADHETANGATKL